MLHPAGSIYKPVFIKDKLKFKAHEAQTQITPPAPLLKMSSVLQCLCSSRSVLTVGIFTKGNDQKTSLSAEIYQPGI